LDKMQISLFESGDLFEQNMECLSEILSDLRLNLSYLNGKKHFTTFKAGKVEFNSSSFLQQ
jgi:hypothetical protein